MVSVRKNTTKAGRALDQFAWSNVEYPFSEFLDRFHLPQLVKVRDGFCGLDEACSLSSDEILTVHAIKMTDKVLARDRTNSKLHIPLDCSQKIELCPQGARDVPGTEAHLHQHKFVRVLQDPHGHNLERPGSTACGGMKLEVVRVQRAFRKVHVVFKNEEGSFVRLPFDGATTRFQPLVDGRAYYLKEVSTMELPVYFKFIDSPAVESVFSSSLGVLKLEKAYRDTTVIYTVKFEGTERVFACPKQIPITVYVPQGALEGDEDYLNLCHSFHGRLNLPKIKNLESENIYENPHDIREYKCPDALMRSLPCSGTSPDHREGLSQREGYKKFPGFGHGESQFLASTSSLHFNSSTQNSPLQEAKADPEDGEGTYECIDKGVTSAVPQPRTKPRQHVMLPFQSRVRAEKRNDKNAPPKPPPVKPKPVILTPSSADESDFEIPDDLTLMSVPEVSKFLKKVHLVDFVDVFEENDVDGEMLVCMTAEDMNALNLNAFQSKKLLKLTKGWRPKV